MSEFITEEIKLVVWKEKQFLFVYYFSVDSASLLQACTVCAFLTTATNDAAIAQADTSSQLYFESQVRHVT